MPCLVHVAVSCDVVVISGESESRLVAGDEAGHWKRLVHPRGTAVNDDKVYLTHFIMIIYL